MAPIVYAILSFSLINSAQETAASGQDQLALWLARAELAPAINQKLRPLLSTASAPDNAHHFIANRVAAQLDQLRGQEGLSDWAPTEQQELRAIMAATEELVEVLLEIRDGAKSRIQKRQLREKQKARKPVFAPGGAIQRGGLTVVDSMRAFSYDAAVAGWRQGIVNRTRSAFKVGSIGANAAALETALDLSWTQVTARLDGVLERIIPPLVSDGYVRSFEVEGLIMGWKRTNIVVTPTARIKETNDPRRKREISYEVVDAFGDTCKGAVVLYSESSGDWRISRDNQVKGGFYELVLLQAN